MKLQGKVALVTGAARRVGRQIVLELARGGCDVAVHYHTSTKAAEELVAEVAGIGRRSVAIRGDLRDSNSWSEVVRHTVGSLGTLDVLVNNASAFLTDSPDTLEGFNLDAWDEMQRINLTAAAALIHHARPHLEAGDGGRVVNLCDSAVERPGAGHLSYMCSKSGLVALTRALAVELAPAITVNGVAPGIAVFPESYDDSVKTAMIEAVPLRRAGDATDIAKAVRFLVESGDYVTGQILGVDGGRSLT